MIANLNIRKWHFIAALAIVFGINSFSSAAKASPEIIITEFHPGIKVSHSVDKEALPTLDVFVSQVRHDGNEPQGVWADELFAYTVNSICWGCVPDQTDTAAYSTVLGRYHGLFIHNYLGGDKLYYVPDGTIFAVIYSDRIEWFQTFGKWMYEAPPDDKTCLYKGEGPFWDWGTDGQNTMTVLEILDGHFTMDELAIQTSVCENGQVGFMMLNASRIGIGITHTFEKGQRVEEGIINTDSITSKIEKE